MGGPHSKKLLFKNDEGISEPFQLFRFENSADDDDDDDETKILLCFIALLAGNVPK